MTPQEIGQNILWFIEGAVRFGGPLAIAFIALHIHYRAR